VTVETPQIDFGLHEPTTAHEHTKRERARTIAEYNAAFEIGNATRARPTWAGRATSEVAYTRNTKEPDPAASIASR
jgi:hypothetical protein